MLTSYRKQIDDLDQQLFQLLDARFAVTKEVGVYKSKQNIPILNENRELEIIGKIKESNLEFSNQIIEVYKQIMTVSKEQQNE